MQRSILWVVLIVAVVAAGLRGSEQVQPLSELEALKIENLNLKGQITDLLKTNSDLQAAVGRCQAALGPMQLSQNRDALHAERDKLKAAMEAARPGYTWDPQTGVFTPKKSSEAKK
jgi:hypothetical protein